MSFGGMLKRLISGAALKESNASSPTGKTVGELQSEPMSAWGNDDIITGLEFIATMQLRTPLRVLLRHGEIHSDRAKPPPEIAEEKWEGIWVPTVDMFRDWKYECASDVGYVLAKDYLPFLIAVRKIVESHDSIESRIQRLREMPLTKNWKAYVDKYGPSHISKSTGKDWIITYFFPRFINSIPKINVATIEELSSLGLDTPNGIESASDEFLLGVKGIGQSKLKVIRDYCASITDNRDADRIENVTR